MSTGNVCQHAEYVEGSARPGTSASVYDPSNVMGGARYKQCGEPAWTQMESGAWLCEGHARKHREIWKQIRKSQEA